MRELISYIEENQEKFYRIAYAYVKNREDALDIVHDAIVHALQSYGTLRHPEYGQTWFYRILTNECVSFLRRSARTIPFADLGASELPGNADIQERENYLDLYSALDMLPPKLKTVVILRFFEELKLEEIAKITGSNLSTTKSRLYRALRILKVDLEDADYD